MDISYDDDKDTMNRVERGIPLAFGVNVMAASIGELRDTWQDYGEIRMRNFGIVDGECFQAFTRSAAQPGISSQSTASRHKGYANG